MIAKKNKTIAFGIAAVVAVAATQFATPVSAFETGSYNLFNHPDAALTDWSNPLSDPTVVYGLRSGSAAADGGSGTPKDGFCALPIAQCGTSNGSWSDAEKTFTVESEKVGGTEWDRTFSHNNSSVWLDWSGDLTTARIHGYLLWNDENPTPDISDVWQVEYNLTNIQSITGGDPTAGMANGAVDGWRVEAGDITGTMTREDGQVIELLAKNDGGGYAFYFDDDGHRCGDYGKFPSNGGDSMCDPGATNELVARGWFNVKWCGDKPGYGWGCWTKGGTNDWLVVAKPKGGTTVAEPGTLALFGLGLIGLGYARRRKTART